MNTLQRMLTNIGKKAHLIGQGHSLHDPKMKKLDKLIEKDRRTLYNRIHKIGKK